LVFLPLTVSVYLLLVLFSCLSFFCLFSLFLLCGFCLFLSYPIFIPSFYLFVFFIRNFLFLRLLGFFKFDCTFQLVFLFPSAVFQFHYYCLSSFRSSRFRNPSKWREKAIIVMEWNGSKLSSPSSFSNAATFQVRKPHHF